jgi:NADH dehydrogenase [ubiquinone] 1 alpha subcomplex assembly factor 5
VVSSLTVLCLNHAHHAKNHPLITVDTEEIVVKYPSMYELMHDLQAMGESNAAVSRKQFTSRDVFLAAGEIYKSIYGDMDGNIPATFEIIYMVSGCAWKCWKGLD